MYINLSNPISFTISCITLIILMFIFINKEWLSMGTVAVQILFNN
jgi:NADH-ubiquinone oxidoreductase chain 2